LMRAHLAKDGLILAASHGPIGLAGAHELRLDQFSSSPLVGETDFTTSTTPSPHGRGEERPL
jgi:hypothetical protein